MSLLTELRNNIDRLFYPFVIFLIQNRKTLRLILIVIIIFSFTTLFVPAFHNKLGSLAWLLLLAILFLSPVSKISQSKALTSLMIFRREMGILMSILAIEHVVLYFIKYQEPFRAIFGADFWVINGAVSYRAFGFTALMLVIPLFITSNNLSMRILKTRWKTLHRLVYIVLIAVAIHLLLLKQEYLKIFIILFAYGLLKILAARGVRIPHKKSPL